MTHFISDPDQDIRTTFWFTPEDSALVLIDHQVGTLQLVRNIASDLSLRNTVALAKAAKVLGMPVVLTTSQEDNVQGPLAPALQRILPEAYKRRIQRKGVVNAWADPAFRAAVEATGRRQLVMAGVTTDVCLVFPSISAVRDGFAVQAVLDASGSPFDLSEDMARRRMERAGVVLTATNTMIAELAGDWSGPTGAELVPLIGALAPMQQAD
ncbi:hypothetical protein P775_11635 [Puniceibacterium antarcticum]|uniref:Isochorismatase-like domain-containing protein n=1 Tax=Puniceibacterium antarcticum TaxID=1206336 RepID=A0A2G8REN2_9RHOB|nr:isochorismatase family protein [Puniceibacterium antarcticum]PIL20000.1 hypothetical protein P775_11635 [Puniceibacterium antarcticum]